MRGENKSQPGVGRGSDRFRGVQRVEWTGLGNLLGMSGEVREETETSASAWTERWAETPLIEPGEYRERSRSWGQMTASALVKLALSVPMGLTRHLRWRLRCRNPNTLVTADTIGVDGNTVKWGDPRWEEGMVPRARCCHWSWFYMYRPLPCAKHCKNTDEWHKVSTLKELPSNTDVNTEMDKVQCALRWGQRLEGPREGYLE